MEKHKEDQKVVKLDGSGLVFCTDKGGPIDPDNFTRNYEYLLKKVSLEHYLFYMVQPVRTRH